MNPHNMDDQTENITQKENIPSQQHDRNTNNVLIILVAFVIIALFGLFVFVKNSNHNQTTPFAGNIPAPTGIERNMLTPTAKHAIYSAQSFGYVGCSNTQDTIEGYHAASGNKNLFWPFGNTYRIGGNTIYQWTNPNDPSWQSFDNMKKIYNAGQEPPVIWVQLCENINSAQLNYHQSNYSEVVQMIKNLRAHAPSSILYISPLQSYNPIDLCSKMGPSGEEHERDTIPWANQAVDQGLALAGPGTKSVPNLGPLTSLNTARDHCHPNGPAHGSSIADSGELFLGSQLMSFFDNLKNP